MGAPQILVENFYNVRQFPSHIIDASEEPGGTEAFRVATGRRTALTNRWRPATANAQAWIRVRCDVSRAADMIALDRGHNLAGVAGVQLQTSTTTDFSAGVTTVASVTIPATASVNGDLSSADGVTTPEGAWLKSFATTSAQNWRLLIPAMGADLRPVVVGLYLGRSYQPGVLDGPFSDDDLATIAPSHSTAYGYRGGAAPVRQRSGVLRLRLTSDAAYADFERHIRDNFQRGRPAWIVFDAAKAERAVLAEIPYGEVAGLHTHEADYAFRSGTIPFIEREPALP